MCYKCNNGLLICGPHNFRIILDISSYLDEFVDFNELIIPIISASVTGIAFMLGKLFG
jgi:hypothetical protein